MVRGRLLAAGWVDRGRSAGAGVGPCNPHWPPDRLPGAAGRPGRGAGAAHPPSRAPLAEEGGAVKAAPAGGGAATSRVRPTRVSRPDPTPLTIRRPRPLAPGDR